MKFEDDPEAWGYKQAVTNKGIRYVLNFPDNPKEGDRFDALCLISGCTYNVYEFRNNKWEFIKNE